MRWSRLRGCISCSPSSITGCSARDGSQLLPVSLPDLSRAAEPRAGPAARAVRVADPKNRRRRHAGRRARRTSTERWASSSWPRSTATRPSPASSMRRRSLPDDVRWPYYLAHLYRLRNEPEKSATFFEQALQLRPDDVAALVWLGGRVSAAGPAGGGRAAVRRRRCRCSRAWPPRCRPGTRGAREKGLRRGREVSRRGAGAGSASPRSSTIRSRWPTAELGELEKAEAHLRQRGHVEPAPARSVDVGVERRRCTAR